MRVPSITSVSHTHIHIHIYTMFGPKKQVSDFSYTPAILHDLQALLNENRHTHSHTHTHCKYHAFIHRGIIITFTNALTRSHTHRYSHSPMHTTEDMSTTWTLVPCWNRILRNFGTKQRPVSHTPSHNTQYNRSLLRKSFTKVPTFPYVCMYLPLHFMCIFVVFLFCFQRLACQVKPV